MIVPVRLLVLLLAATEKLTVPLPLPLAPAVTVIQVLLLVAVHVQPVADVTPTELEPPALVAECVVEASVNVQDTPACVTVNV